MKKLIIVTLSAALLLTQTAFAGTICYRSPKATYCYSYNSDCGYGGIFSKYFTNCKKPTGAQKPTTQPTTQPSRPTPQPTTQPSRPTPQPTTKATTEAPTETTTAAKPSTPSVSQSSEAKQVLDLVNKERAAKGLKSLTLDSSLTNAANLKAQDMADKGYFDHTSPTYGTPFRMLKTLGISYSAAGENIAKGQRSAEAVMNAWMNSSGHRANILNSSYGKLGVGYVVKNGTTYWVQIFTN